MNKSFSVEMAKTKEWKKKKSFLSSFGWNLYNQSRPGWFKKEAKDGELPHGVATAVAVKRVTKNVSIPSSQSRHFFSLFNHEGGLVMMVIGVVRVVMVIEVLRVVLGVVVGRGVGSRKGGGGTGWGEHGGNVGETENVENELENRSNHSIIS